jgi:DNA recombination protein RmuC
MESIDLHSLGIPEAALPVLLLGGVAAVILLLLILLLRGSGGARAQAELAGRFAQLAEGMNSTQDRLAERLQAQERALSQNVEQRLADFSKRLGDRLQEHSTQSHNTLSDLRERLAVIDKAQQNITELSSQVVSLQDILANKQARGAFGEVQLKDIVSAILPPSAYDFQVVLSGGQRADCLLRLPNPPGPIAIDAKFPLESYQALRDAKDEAQRVQAARAFAADVRKHVQDIASKYIQPGETAESALMFLPSEAVYAELHASFRAVVEESYRARVWIVSPTTLMATLNTVRAVLKDVRMREQAGVIQNELLMLLRDVERLDERVGKLQRHHDQSGEDLRQIRISTDKVTKRAERIEELQLEEAEAPEESLAPPQKTLGLG